jgi:hypothetical protein
MSDGLWPKMKTRTRTFKKRHPLRSSAVYLGLIGLAYALYSAVLALAGDVPTAPVVAGIDPDNYYAWQILFILPLFYAVWILASGVLLALGTKGCHRSEVLVRASRAWGGPLLIAWLPSAVRAGFAALGLGQAEWVDILSPPGLWQTLYLAVCGAAGLWAVWKFIRAARTIHKKSWPGAVATGLAASVVAIGVFVLFVR